MYPIHKEHLYTEDYFIRYCHRDELNGNKFDIEITPMFLRAAEKDGLIIPLIIEKQKRKKGEIEEEVNVRYYSPFQIFLVGALIRNDVDDDGNLRDPSSREWQKQQNFRHINWGGWSAFSAEIYKKKRGEEPDDLGNHFSIADDFHQVLRLIHSLEPENRYELMWGKQRLFTRLPNLVYNLDPIRKDSTAYIEEYSLDAKKLKRVIASVGYLATHIDPLERWFYYIRRHSQTHRDQLKGPAAVSQDLYGFCDICYDIIEIVFGEKLPPLPDLLHPGIKPYLMDRAGYATGDDIKAIRSAFVNLQRWVKENGLLIEDLHPTIEHKKLNEALIDVDSQISDYEKRYGDRRYVGSTRTIWPETKLKITDLDEGTRKIVESMVGQRAKDETKNKEQLEDLIALEITHAIEWRMGDLQRAVSGIAFRMAEAMWPLEHKLEHEKEMAKYPALKELGERVKKDDPDYARKYHEFWQKSVKEVERPVQKKIDQLDLARKELHGIGGQVRLVFCAVCRARPVILHHAQTDSQISSEVVCDECFEQEKTKAMVGTTEDGKKMKYAEWICGYCGEKVLLKFALSNTISVRTQNQVPIQISLDYGHMELEAKCTHCSHVNHRSVDWGWTP
jgi:hypothetical protein